MRFCRFSSGLAVAVLALGLAGIAKADGSDPKVHIVAPTDPVIEPCSNVPENITCFTSNSVADPLVVTGPTLQQLETGDYDFLTNFIYEPNDPACTSSGCPASDTLMSLWIEINPTISAPAATYTCDIGPSPDGETPAFNNPCPTAVAVNLANGTELMEISCDPTVSACTGLLPGEEGAAVISPEPGEMAMLGLGIALVGFCGWKRRQSIVVNQAGSQNLAIS